MQKYYIYPARLEEVHEGLIWIKDSNIRSRTVVKIFNPSTRREIYCKALPVDATDGIYFEKTRKRQLAIFMNGWYRKSLGRIEEHHSYELTVSSSMSIYFRAKAALDHPQAIVRISITFAIWSILLTTLGVLMSYIFWLYPLPVR